jgi:hypothetical protein
MSGKFINLFRIEPWIIKEWSGWPMPYIPFKKNAFGSARGSSMWKKMYHYFQLNRDEFLKHYHKRSNIESTNAAIKRKFGETLKSKNRIAQENELLAKIIAYNLTVVIHEMYENGIDPEFLNRKSDLKSKLKILILLLLFEHKYTMFE